MLVLCESLHKLFLVILPLGAESMIVALPNKKHCRWLIIDLRLKYLAQLFRTLFGADAHIYILCFSPVVLLGKDVGLSFEHLRIFLFRFCLPFFVVFRFSLATLALSL